MGTTVEFLSLGSTRLSWLRMASLEDLHARLRLVIDTSLPVS
jgi:hypothetical protein